jgi:hypothetical protein
MLKNITHEEWINIKNNTKDFNDIYINCNNDRFYNLSVIKNVIIFKYLIKDYII